MAVQASRLMDGLLSEGVQCVRISSSKPFPPMLRRLESLVGIRTLFRFFFFMDDLRKLKHVQTVHLFAASNEYFFLVVIPAVIFSRVYGRKLLINYRGGEADAFLRRLGFVVRPILKKADAITVPSGFLQAVLGKHGINDVKVVPNISDTSRFIYRQRGQLRPNIIVTRNLETIYNIPCALRAFDRIRSVYPEARMTILGSGSQEEYLKEMARKMGLKNVLFLGSVPNEQLPAHYNEADIFLNSSSEDNFPGSILESWASGVPVVTTNAGGIPWMVKDDETGLISEVNNPDQLAKNIFRLLDDPELSRRLSANGREASSRHEWKNVKSLLIDAYAR